MNCDDNTTHLIAHQHCCGHLVYLFLSREQIVATRGGSMKQVRRARAIDKMEYRHDLAFARKAVSVAAHRLIDAAREKSFVCACGQVIRIADVLSQFDDDTPSYFIPYPGRERRH